MSYQHFTIEERSKIEVLYQEGYKMNDIARILNRHRSSIYRELKRCRGDHYQAKVAQQNVNHLKKAKGRKPIHTPELLQDLQEKLVLTWSPEQIVGRSDQGLLSFKTIYNWLYNGVLTLPLSVLRHKGKRRQPKETRGRFNVGTPTAKRPKSVKKRQEIGHWECDTVVSSRGKSKGCLATFAERKSRFYVALPMPDRSKTSMLHAIQQLIMMLARAILKTFTWDRGKEFACYPEVEAQGINFYFLDPYRAWQRGTNENSNGLLREFFPKKTDLATFTQEALTNALWLINNRPRKYLNYQTPFEVFMNELVLME